MTLSRQEILDYAARYVSPEAITEFPFNGDLFCLLDRILPEGKILAEEEGWVFHGYGICSGYLLDDEAKPAGKWLWMHFMSLSIFPPTPQVLKLQPPHVVKGRFFSPDRTLEYRILKVAFTDEPDETDSATPPPPPEPATRTRKAVKSDSADKKIVKFRKKGTAKI